MHTKGVKLEPKKEDIKPKRSLHKPSSPKRPPGFKPPDPRTMSRLEKLAMPKHGPYAFHYDTARDVKEAAKRAERRKRREEKEKEERPRLPGMPKVKAVSVPETKASLARKRAEKGGTSYEVKLGEPKRARRPQLPDKRPPRKKRPPEPKKRPLEPKKGSVAKKRKPTTQQKVNQVSPEVAVFVPKRERKPALDMGRKKTVKKPGDRQKAPEKKRPPARTTTKKLKGNPKAGETGGFSAIPDPTERMGRPLNDNAEEVDNLLSRMKRSSSNDVESPLDPEDVEAAEDSKLRSMFRKLCWWL